jgi:DHA1 family tetracycline resistance protein-like MFS transporter
MQNKKAYIAIFLIIVTETLGFSLILPFLPFYAQSMGASPFTVGLILTVFSFFQFFSAPIAGRLSDIYGRKPLLILSQLSTFLSFVILGMADTLFLVFVSRIVDGLLGSNFTIAQAYLSDISSKKDRSKAFGLTGAAFGVGFLIGPAIGGTLSLISYSLPAYIAAGITIITILITHFYLRETVQRDPNRKFHISDIKPIDIKLLEESIKNPEKRRAFWAFFTFVLAHTIFVSTYALYGERQLGFGALETGYALTFVGITNIILRGMLLSKLIDFFGENLLRKLGVISLIIGFLILSVVHSTVLFGVTIILFAFGSGVLRPLILSFISRQTSDSKQGEVMGLTGSIGSITQIISPLLGGYIISAYPAGMLPIASLFALLLGAYETVRLPAESK